jgi:hypothetical protein
LVIGGFRGERGRKLAETLKTAVQERFGFVSPAEDIPLLEKLRRLHRRTERTATFLRQHLCGSDGRHSSGQQLHTGDAAARGILTGEIVALEDLLYELFGLGRGQASILPLCTADAVMSILRTFDLSRDFRAWLGGRPNETAVPADLAQRIDTSLSLLQRAIATEEAAAGQTGQPAIPENGPVVLRGPGDCPIVGGVQKRPLTLPQYEVVKAVLQAGERGLSKDELNRNSKHEDARKILKRLADSDADWEAIIHFAGRAGGRYRIG